MYKKLVELIILRRVGKASKKMNQQISSILQRATRNKLDRLNIISYPCHERFQTGLSDINADFYLWQQNNGKKWNYKYGPLPKNHILLNPKYGDNQLPDYVVPDCILMQNKLAEYNTTINLSNRYRIPIINISHCLPWISISQKQMQQIHNMRADIEVFITKYSRDQWGYNENNAIVIEHNIDNTLFKPYDMEKIYDVLMVVNDLINRDWCCGYSLFKEISGYPNNCYFDCKIVGDTPGLSLPAQNIKELVEIYNQSKVFLCTATVSPISMALLEAMSCGLGCVAYASCAVPEIIQHGYNGLISTSPTELRKYCIDLLNDEDMRKELGNNARKTVIERFNTNRFTKEWENILRSLI